MIVGDEVLILILIKDSQSTILFLSFKVCLIIRLLVTNLKGLLK